MSKTKTILLILLILIAGFFVYSYISKTPDPIGTLSTAPSAGQGAAGSAVGNDFLAILLNIKKIKLDNTILNRDSFTSLQDFTKIIPPESNPGRPNPFAPIGSDAASSTVFPTTSGVFAPVTPTPAPADTASSTQVTTSAATTITKNGAILNGSLSQGGSTTTRWFEWGVSPTALSSTSTPVNQAGGGTFTRTLTNLSPGTTYYFRAVATVAGVRMTGETLSFKTLAQ